MKAISRFTLEQHDGPYASWPLRSRLFLDGEPTGLTLPGYVLSHQFETADGYLLVTDYDCPFEELTSFSLVSKQLRLLSCRWLGEMYETFLVERLEWIDERIFIAVIYSDLRWRFTIRSWGIPYLRPRLGMKFLGKAVGGRSRSTCMGQVHVASVQVGQLPEVIAALSGAGFDVVRVESENQEVQHYRCRRGDREIILEVNRGRQGTEEALVVLAHPPYTVWPWRWLGDGRFFGDITEVLDGFRYRD